MKELIEQLEQKATDLFRDAHSQLDKGNKAAGLRARRTSLEMEPLLKQFRKMSLEIANDRRKYQPLGNAEIEFRSFKGSPGVHTKVHRDFFALYPCRHASVDFSIQSNERWERWQTSRCLPAWKAAGSLPQFVSNWVFQPLSIGHVCLTSLFPFVWSVS